MQVGILTIILSSKGDNKNKPDGYFNRNNRAIRWFDSVKQNSAGAMNLRLEGTTKCEQYLVSWAFGIPIIIPTNWTFTL